MEGKCAKCHKREGFCIHTIEQQYKAFAVDYNNEEQFFRSYAILKFAQSNLRKCLINYEKELIDKNDIIKSKDKELEHYKWLDEKLKEVARR